MSPNTSAVTPNNTGTTAPPIMAVIISPDISFARAGIVSTVIEKISGNMFAKPSQVRNMNENAMTSLGEM